MRSTTLKVLFALVLSSLVSFSAGARTCEDVLSSTPQKVGWFDFLRSKSESPATLYLSSARNGQSETYRLLSQLLKFENRDAKVQRIGLISSWFQIWKIKAGDTLLVNIYSYDPILEMRLAALKRKGVRILVDVEITAQHHLRVLNREVSRYKDYTLVTGSAVVADAMKAKWPDSEVVLLPHLETLYFHPAAKDQNRVAGVLGPSEPGDPSRKRLLMIHQYHVPGENFAGAFFRAVDEMDLKDVDIIVALHPHSEPEQILKYESLAATHPNLKVVVSTEGIKTNDLFPYVDAVISHSSTLADVAKSLNVPVFDSNYGQNFNGLKAFIDGLDISARAERERALEQYSSDALHSWTALLFEPN